ncbi:MAG: serine/threonine protein kinase [Planctomycetes bacterium]|nr:serine/threonine protein kinase [Planctomycetota bacterium]
MSEFRWGAAPEPELPNVPGYRILGRLGAGGMGVVYHAWDETLERNVALKLTRRRQLPADSAARFQREAELLARFCHPGVISVHSWGETPDWLYLVCDLVEEAQSFDEACATRSSEDQIVLARDLCEVLAALHEVGVVHRDIKPGNVLVTPQGAIKLVDFGIATAEELRRLTLSGAFVGTPLYSAPERIRLEGKGADPAADVWSAAAMLYEVLTGRLPFEATSYAGVVAASEFPPPSVAELRPDLPTWISAALDHALSLDPTTRPSAAELALGLGGEAGKARHGRWRIGVALAGLLLGVTGLGWAALEQSPVDEHSSSTNRAADSPSPTPTPTPSASPSPQHEWEQILATQDRAAAARFVRPALEEGRENALVVALGEEAAVEFLALGLLPPTPEQIELPPEWRRLSLRLRAGRPALVEAIGGAIRGETRRTIETSLLAGQRAEPEAPWWLLRGLLGRELGLPAKPLPAQVPAVSGPWALRDWKAFLLLGPASKRRERLAQIAERTGDLLLRDLIQARLVPEGTGADLETRAAAKNDGRVALRLAIQERFANHQPTPFEFAAAMDELAPRGLRLYGDLVVVRNLWILRAFKRRPTRLGFRVAQRFVERSFADLEGSALHQRQLLEGLVLMMPALREFVWTRAAEAGQRSPADFKSIAILARGLTPIPRDLALPPEWRERVAALDSAARPGVRRAVELAICGRPWRELEVQMSSAHEASPQESGVAIARALLALARGALGVLSLEDICAELPPRWAGLIRSRCLHPGSRPPEWLAPLGLEYELDLARYPTPDLGRLRELAPHHSQAAFALALLELPKLLSPEVLETYLRELDPHLELTGALYVAALVPRSRAAWNWGLAQERTGIGKQILLHALELAPDGPAVLGTTWSRALPVELWRRLLIEWAPRWPQSGAAQGQAGCILALAYRAEGKPLDEALEFLDRARALNARWRPSAPLLKRLREVLPELCAERFGDE